MDNKHREGIGVPSGKRPLVLLGCTVWGSLLRRHGTLDQAKAQRHWTKTWMSFMEASVMMTHHDHENSYHRSTNAVRLACIFIVAVFLLGVIMAYAHDDADWIRRGGYRSTITGETCCGEHDCRPTTAIEVPGGYKIMGTPEIIPHSQTLKSEDAQFWACRRPNGSMRCFFAPRGGV